MNTHAPKLSSGWRWPRVAAVLVLTIAAVAAGWDAWRDIFHIATRDEESSHIFLIPVVVGWLVWVRRRRLKHCRLAGAGLGTAIMAVGAVLHCTGDRYLIHVFWHGGAVLLLLGAVVTVLGGDVLKQFLPAAIALLFVVPVPGRLRQKIALPMEGATAAATEKVYEVLGQPIERSGNALTLNGVDVAIAEACNGLRMVIALTMVSYALAFGTPLRWYVRVILLVLSPVSAIACNVVRLVPTVWLFGYHSLHVAEWFHDISGWVMLFVSFFILIGVIRLLRWALVPVNQFVLAYD
jgi:exosortase